MRSIDPPVLRYPFSWRSWRFRMAIGIVGLVLLVRLVWGWQVRRLLHRQHEIARGRGEPVVLEDVRFESVADEENAWKVQLKAMAARSKTVQSPLQSMDEYVEYPPFPDSWMKRAAASEAANAQAFSLARRARSLLKVQTRDRLESPLVKQVLPASLIESRDLARILSDGAIYSHLQGDDTEAIERLLDLLHLADSVRHEPYYVSQLVAIGMDSLASSFAQIIAPGLRLDGSGATRSEVRARVRVLIERLLDDRYSWEAFKACPPMEKFLQADYLRIWAGESWLIRPLADMQFVRMSRNYDVAIEAEGLRTMPAIRAAMSKARPERSERTSFTISFGPAITANVPRYSRWFLSDSGIATGYFSRQIEGIAERRLTAVSLAAQLFRAERGRWPAKLEELVPDYLKGVPLDPFHDDGRAIGYETIKGGLPDGGDRPVIYYDPLADYYSIVKREPMYGWQMWQPMDVRGHKGHERQYRDLARFIPPPAAPKPPSTSRRFPLRSSTKAVDGNPDKASSPGK